MARDRRSPAEKYIDDVLKKKIVVCNYVMLAVLRHQKDLETGYQRGLVFNKKRARFALDFFKLRDVRGNLSDNPCRHADTPDGGTSGRSCLQPAG